MDKIKLKNGSVYEIEVGATEHSVSMLFATIDESVPVVKEFNMPNMEVIEFLTAEDEVCGVYCYKCLKNTVGYVLEDGTYRVVFVIGNVDMTEKRLAVLEESQNIQDEAIIELASLVG